MYVCSSVFGKTGWPGAVELCTSLSKGGQRSSAGGGGRSSHSCVITDDIGGGGLYGGGAKPVLDGTPALPYA